MIPGDSGYSDFWRVTKVTVPQGYVANQVTSLEEIVAAGYPLAPTTTLVNCPVVPDGSKASLRYTSAEPTALQRLRRGGRRNARLTRTSLATRA